MTGEDTGVVAVTAPATTSAVWTVHGDITQIAEPWVSALGELTEVARTQTANAGTYSYTYADLGDVLGHSRPVLARHGLALFQVPTVADGEVSMATVVMHTSGTFLQFAPLRLPAGPTAQSTGSAATYGRRYSVMSILGLATEDNDGQTAGTREPPAPLLMPLKYVERFRTAAAEALLTVEEIGAVVLDATEGRTPDPAEVWTSEVDALRDALARAAQPTPASDEEDEAWVETARGLSPDVEDGTGD